MIKIVSYREIPNNYTGLAIIGKGKFKSYVSLFVSGSETQAEFFNDHTPEKRKSDCLAAWLTRYKNNPDVTRSIMTYMLGNDND